MYVELLQRSLQSAVLDTTVEVERAAAEAAAAQAHPGMPVVLDLRYRCVTQLAILFERVVTHHLLPMGPDRRADGLTRLWKALLILEKMTPPQSEIRATVGVIAKLEFPQVRLRDIFGVCICFLFICCR